MSAVSVSESGVRPILADAVDLARRALLELEPAGVGAHLGVAAEDDSAATHHFEATLPGYRGWQWAVVVAAPPEADYATVSESALLPGPDALVAPDFVPWDQRVRPGDLAPGDLLAPPPNDPRLVPGYVANGDPAVDEVALEIGLGRPQVLSLEGREEAAERWYTEFGPDADMAKAAPSTCGLCGFYLPLAGSMRAAFGVCGNAMGADGHVVHVAYGCGAHSDTVAPTGGGSPLYEAFDDAAVDLIPAEELLAPAAKEAAAEAESADAAATTDVVVEEAPSAETESAEATEAPVAEAESAVADVDAASAEIAPSAETAAESDDVATGIAAAPVEDVQAVETESADESGASLVTDPVASVADPATTEAAQHAEVESADASAVVEAEHASNVAAPVAETESADAAVVTNAETTPAAADSVAPVADTAETEAAQHVEVESTNASAAVETAPAVTPVADTGSADAVVVTDVDAAPADVASSAETVAESGDVAAALVEETPATDTESADEPIAADVVAPVVDTAVAEGTLSADVQIGESGSAAGDVAEVEPSFDIVVEPSGSVTVVADSGDAEADAQASSGDEQVVDGGADSSPQS